MGFPRQEYCSGLPFPTPDDLANPGVKLVSLTSPAQQFFTSEATGSPSIPLARAFPVLASALRVSDSTPSGLLRCFPKQNFSLGCVLMPAIKIAKCFISAKFLSAWHLEMLN